MRRLLWLILFIACTLDLLSQQPPPVMRSRSELVLVPVEVRRHGQHVSGLSDKQFTVLQDGHAQEIRSFDEIRTTTERLTAATVGAGEFTNDLHGRQETARYTVLAIDRINTTAEDMNRLRDGLKRFLEQAAANREPIRLIAVSAGRIHVIQDFTSDVRLISAALSKTPSASGQALQDSTSFNDALTWMDTVLSSSEAGGSAMPQSQGEKHMEQSMIQFMDRGRRISSLEALQQVALSLAGLPGRKSLVWASSGYRFDSLLEEPVPTDSPMSSIKLSFKDVLEASALDEYTTNILNSANIAVYPVDVRGPVNVAYELMSPNRKYSAKLSQKTFAQGKEQEIITSFERLASSTGGKACYGRADVSGCFIEAMEDARDYYMLGFYIDRSRIKPGWHKLSVKVDQKGVNVRARGGFLYAQVDPEQVKTMDMSLELGSRFVNPGLPFRGRWLPTTAKADKTLTPFELSLPASSGLVTDQQKHLNMEVAAVAYRPDGTVAAQVAQHVERDVPSDVLARIQREGITYKNTLELAAGRYLVRIAVRDNMTARMGSLSVILTVQ